MGTTLNGKERRLFSSDASSPCFESYLLDAELVDKCARSMKLGKASGPDDLTVEYILNAHPILITHLCCLFKTIIKHNYVPTDFGLGTIVSLLKDKAGDSENVCNYCGITLIPVII